MAAGRLSSGAVALCLLAGLGAPAGAQAPSFAAFRDAAIAAMGGASVERMELGGDGTGACLGQAWSVSEGWAPWEITDYRRVIDYVAAASVERSTRRPGMDPERVGGCGAQPGGAAQHLETRIAPASAWADQLPIWLTPHGFLRLGERADGRSVVRDGEGWRVTIPVALHGAAFTLNGYYGEDHLIDRIVTFVDDPVFGNMEVEALFADYRAFGDLTFPSRLVYKQGGSPTLEIAIRHVAVNADAAALDTASGPAGASRGDGSEGPRYTKIGDGIFVMHGRYQAVAVEFHDFSVLIDGLQSDSRTEELIRLTHEAIPGKPIRYAVSTHSHFDHASGLRLLAAEGATILMHDSNVAFFEAALRRPRTLSRVPEPASHSPIEIRGISERSVLTDGSSQVVELHTLAPSPHAADMLIAYLPSIKTIVEADILQPWIEPAFGGDGDEPHPYLVYLFDELERLRLDYTQFVPIHQPPEPPTMPRSALQEAVGR